MEVRNKKAEQGCSIGKEEYPKCGYPEVICSLQAGKGG